MSSEHLAAIDIGTNSIHLVVARFDDAGHFEVIADEKETVRLGSAGGDMKQLQPDAIDRGIAALTRFRQVADISEARVVAVATSAVREAENADDVPRPGPARGRRRGRGHLRHRGGPPDPPRRPPGRPRVRPAPPDDRHRRRQHRGAGGRGQRHPRRPQLQARRHPPDPAVLPHRPGAPRRGRRLPSLHRRDAGAARPGGRPARLRGGRGQLGHHRGGGRR